MAIHKLFSKILLIQTYHSTRVSFSCEFITADTILSVGKVFYLISFSQIYPVWIVVAIDD